MRILAVDPGETTGFAIFDDEATTHYGAWEDDDPFHVLDLVATELKGSLDVLVCESFVITPATARKTRGGSNTTIEMVGVMRWLAHVCRVPFILQTPADAAGFSTNDKLKRSSMWTVGDHARSASRHLLLYLVRSGAIDPKILLD